MICHINITPFCIFSSFHISNSRNTINNRTIVTMVPFHSSKFWVFKTCGKSIIILFFLVKKVYLYRIIWIKIHYITVFYINSWNTVLSICHYMRIIKTNLIWSWRYFRIVIYFICA